MADQTTVITREQIATARIKTRLESLVNERAMFQDQTQQQIDLESQAIARDQDALNTRRQNLDGFVQQSRLNLSGYNAAIGELTVLLEPEAEPDAPVAPVVADAPVAPVEDEGDR